jgi:hypothetical protein
MSRSRTVGGLNIGSFHFPLLYDDVKVIHDHLLEVEVWIEDIDDGPASTNEGLLTAGIWHLKFDYKVRVGTRIDTLKLNDLLNVKEDAVQICVVSIWDSWLECDFPGVWDISPVKEHTVDHLELSKLSW